MKEPISVVFLLSAALAEVLKVSPINRLESAWTLQIDECWTIAVNGLKQKQKAGPEEFHVYLEPNHLAAWRDGWLVGILNPYGGVIIGRPETGIEDDLILAMLHRLEKEYGGRDKFPPNVAGIAKNFQVVR